MNAWHILNFLAADLRLDPRPVTALTAAVKESALEFVQFPVRRLVPRPCAGHQVKEHRAEGKNVSGSFPAVVSECAAGPCLGRVGRLPTLQCAFAPAAALRSQPDLPEVHPLGAQPVGHGILPLHVAVDEMVAVVHVPQAPRQA